MTSPDDHLSPDWFFCNLSNVHIAKDRDSFTSYTPFQSTIHPVYLGGPAAAVHGIGTVELHPKPTPDSTSPKVLRLTEVLHVPQFICNVIGSPILDHYIVALRHKANSAIYTVDGEQVACFHPGRRLFVLDVKAPGGEEVDETEISARDWDFVPSYHWRDEERSRWKRFRAVQGGSQKMSASSWLRELFKGIILGLVAIFFYRLNSG